LYIDIHVKLNLNASMLSMSSIYYWIALTTGFQLAAPGPGNVEVSSCKKASSVQDGPKR
jgi:hypothetical protein